MKLEELKNLNLRYDWEFLIDWNNRLFEVRDEIFYSDDQLGINEGVNNSKWLGYTGLSQDQIDSLENKLSAKLPISYKEFLQISNGWRYLGTDILKMSNSDEVDWYVKKSKEEYELYISAIQDIQSEDIVNLKHTLQITEQIADELYTYHLSTKSMSSDGECEAWTFWKYQDLDIRKYSSFYHLMLSEYKEFRKTFD